jgi:DtxR family Mn-dependent transcriptional regulator
VAGWMPLTQILVGEQVILRRIHELAEENADLLAYLERAHLLPGAALHVTEILPFNQTITVEVEGQSVVLGYAAARYLFVERET